MPLHKQYVYAENSQSLKSEILEKILSNASDDPCQASQLGELPRKDIGGPAPFQLVLFDELLHLLKLPPYIVPQHQIDRHV